MPDTSTPVMCAAEAKDRDNTKRSRQERLVDAVLALAFRLPAGLAAFASFLVALYILGWIYTLSYLFAFNALWLLDHISTLGLLNRGVLPLIIIGAMTAWGLSYRGDFWWRPQ